MKPVLSDVLSQSKGSVKGIRVLSLTIIVLGVGFLLLTVRANDVQPSYAQGPMPSMTPMMTGTHEPMPSMTPMMTMTPQPTAPPDVDDSVAPEGTILVNGGVETTTNPLVTLTLSAEDDPGGTGVAWMYIREWGWDHDHGWHDMHRDGRHGDHHGGMGHMMGDWQDFAPTVEWELSPEPGVKYVTVWFADAAWNVSSPATAMINLVTEGAAINAGQVHRYRHRLQAGQSMSVTVRPSTGDPDLYAWTPGNAGSPDWWSNASAGDDQVTLTAPMDGLYLIEVHGYSDAMYDLDTATEISVAVEWLDQDKLVPAAPLVTDAPDTSVAPQPGFRLYLPALLHRP